MGKEVVIIDTSALLAVLFSEAEGQAMVAALRSARQRRMSTVNLCETVVLAADRRAVAPQKVMDWLRLFAIDYLAPDSASALLAAAARLRFPLNFGDCFAYALARTSGEPLLTLDADFGKTDVKLVAW